MYGFDTAGTLAEETNDPRRTAPPAIIRALIASSIIGGLLIIFALMSVKNIDDPNIGLLGLPFIIKQALGNTTRQHVPDRLGDRDHRLHAGGDARPASGCCSRWRVTGACRSGRTSPASRAAPACRSSPRCSSVSWRSVILAINLGNQSAFLTLTSVAIVMFYMPISGSPVGMLFADQGTWPRAEHGPYFSLGRWGLLVNLIAVVYGAVVAVNIAWPRSAVYDALAGTKDSSGHVIPAHWYWQYIAILFIGIVVPDRLLYYFAGDRASRPRCFASMRAAVPMLPDEPIGEVAP